MKTIPIISLMLCLGLAAIFMAFSEKNSEEIQHVVSTTSFHKSEVPLPAKLFKRPKTQRTVRVCKKGCAYKTIETALYKAQHGDEIVVAPGIYREHPYILDKKTKSNKWIVIRSEVPFAAKISNNNQYHVFEITRSNNIWFEGFELSSQEFWEANTQKNFGIFINNSSNIRVLNNFVHHVGCSGIQANGGDNYAIVGNIISTVTRNDFCSGISLWDNFSRGSAPVFTSQEINFKHDVQYYVANNVVLDAMELKRKGKYLKEISDGNGIIVDHHRGQKEQYKLQAKDRIAPKEHYLVENNIAAYCGLRGFHSLTANAHFRNNFSAWSSRVPSSATVNSASRSEFTASVDYNSFCGNIGLARFDREDAPDGPNVAINFQGYGEKNPPKGLELNDNVMFINGPSLKNRTVLNMEERSGTSFHDWVYDSWRNPNNGRWIWNKADKLALISQAANNYYGQDPGILPKDLIPLEKYGSKSQLKNGQNNPAEKDIKYDAYEILRDVYLATKNLKHFEVSRCQPPVWDFFGEKRWKESIAGPYAQKSLQKLQ